MKHSIKISAVVIAMAFLLSACGNPPQYGQSLYDVSEAGVAKTVVRCKVLGVREIALRDAQAVEDSQAAGLLAGGLLGAALGGTVGGDKNDQDLGAVVGGLAGAVAGSAIGENLGENSANRRGLEYAILTDSEEEITIVQEFLEGDRIIAPGEDCRLQRAAGYNRVLDIAGLPETVARPKTTTFSE